MVGYEKLYFLAWGGKVLGRPCRLSDGVYTIDRKRVLQLQRRLTVLNLPEIWGDDLGSDESSADEEVLENMGTSWYWYEMHQKRFEECMNAAVIVESPTDKKCAHPGSSLRLPTAEGVDELDCYAGLYLVYSAPAGGKTALLRQISALNGVKHAIVGEPEPFAFPESLIERALTFLPLTCRGADILVLDGLTTQVEGIEGPALKGALSRRVLGYMSLLDRFASYKRIRLVASLTVGSNTASAELEDLFSGRVTGMIVTSVRQTGISYTRQIRGVDDRRKNTRWTGFQLITEPGQVRTANEGTLAEGWYQSGEVESYKRRPARLVRKEEDRVAPKGRELPEVDFQRSMAVKATARTSIEDLGSPNPLPGDNASLTKE